MTDPDFEPAPQPTTPDDHVGHTSNLVWIAIAIVLAAICTTVAFASFEPVGCGPLCDLPTDPP